MVWPTALSHFALFLFPGLSQLLVVFLIHHVSPAAVPLHSACLLTVSQISISDGWHTLLPHHPLTGELILPAPLLNGFILTATTAFSHGSSQSGALGVQGQRRAHSQMSLGVCYASEIRLPPHIHRLSPTPHPREWSCSVPWPFSFGNISPMLCNFCPYRGLPASLKLNFSVACRPAKDGVSNYILH